MARALTGYGEYHSLAEHASSRAPRTHPEKMALAAGVLLDIYKNDPETTSKEKEPNPTTVRRVGTKALESTSA